MADHIDENAETSVNKRLDQNAIDEALSAMQVDDSDDAAAKNEPAAHSNGGETFAAAQSDGHEDLDAAIAALQADDPADEVVAKAQSPESAEANQEDIDAAMAAMQADAAADEEAAAAEPVESADAGQEDVDAALAAMQADAAADEEASETEPAAAEDVGQEDIDATIAAMQADGSDDVDANEVSENESGEASPADIDVAIAAMQDDSDASAETQMEPDQEPFTSEPELDARSINPAEASDDANTFSGLDEDDLTDSGPSPDQPGAKGPAELPNAPDGGDDFSGLDDNTNPTTVQVKKAPVSIPTVSAGATDSKPHAAVERLPEVTGKTSGSKTTGAAKGSRSAGKKRISVVALCLIVLVGSAAYFGRDLYWVDKKKPMPPAAGIPEVEYAPAKTLAPSPQPVAVQNPYHEKLREVARLRADLLSKKDEIDRLRQFYRDGISELEEELQQEATRQGVQKFSQAIGNNKIKLDLESIQRRWAYIDELAKPYHWLQQGSEELLFLSRRTEIDLQMDAIAAGIELTKHMRRLNASMQKFQLSPERLAIDVSNSRLRPLEEIWQAISTQNKAIAQKAVANGDQAIIDEICSGDTGRIAELTTLTIKASKCLSQLDTSELFLNRLTFLSPVAAKYLSNWGGQWLCLNGFHKMTPEVARHLFRWEGNWISLNGLEDFSPQIGELLLAWEGHQLELMGLVFKADQAEKIGLQQLSDWEMAGGKLFVPESIRAEMEKLK